MLTSEAEDNWELFFANIKNEDYKENFLEGFAGMIVNGLEMYDSIPRDSVLGQAPLLVNGFLIANKLPGYNSKKPLESVLKIVTKAWKVYSPVADVDIGPHIEMISQALSQAYQSQSHGNSFTKLSSKEKKALITRMVDSEIISPVQSVWSAYDKSRTETTCSKHLLCLVNLREVKTVAGSARLVISSDRNTYIDIFISAELPLLRGLVWWPAGPSAGAPSRSTGASTRRCGRAPRARTAAWPFP